MPSDRFTTFSSSSTAGSGVLNSNGTSNYTKSPSSNYHSKQQVYSKNGKVSASSTNTFSMASGQPKKFVSMSRLNQLAQPKKRTPATTAQPISSSSSTNRSTNSLNRTINKTQLEANNSDRNNSASQADQIKRHQQRPPTVTKTTQPQTEAKPKRESLGKKLANPIPARTSLTNSHSKRQSDVKQPQRQKQQLQGRKILQPSTPLITSIKSSTMMTPSSTTDLPIRTPQSSTPIARTLTSPRDHKTTPAVNPPLLLTPAASEEERSLIENLDSEYNDREQSDQHSQPAVDRIGKRTFDESSHAEQISEMSINDPFYQSAASELMPDSENSTNGINFDRNTDSLFREIEQDLVAMGIKKDTENSFKDNDILKDLDRRNSTATIVTESPSTQQKVTASQKEAQEEDDRRMKIEKELREKARREEEERKERDKIVENIMARFVCD